MNYKENKTLLFVNVQKKIIKSFHLICCANKKEKIYKYIYIYI